MMIKDIENFQNLLVDFQQVDKYSVCDIILTDFAVETDINIQVYSKSNIRKSTKSL